MARVGPSFSKMVWKIFLAVRWQESTSTLEDTRTMQRPLLTWHAVLVRNNFTELYHVLIMLTRRRAQRLVLKTAEPEGLVAYRILLRRYEPVSTVTTVSKLVDLLATTFSGDLMDSFIDL